MSDVSQDNQQSEIESKIKETREQLKMLMTRLMQSNSSEEQPELRRNISSLREKLKDLENKHSKSNRSPTRSVAVSRSEDSPGHSDPPRHNNLIAPKGDGHTEKQKRGWPNWGDWPPVVIILVIASLIPIIGFITGKQSFKEILLSLQANPVSLPLTEGPATLRTVPTVALTTGTPPPTKTAQIFPTQTASPSSSNATSDKVTAVANTSTPLRATINPISLAIPTPLKRSVAVIEDSEGNKTIVNNLKFTYGHGWNFTMKAETITIQFHGGYIRIPFRNIQRIDKVAVSESENHKATMRVELSNGQVVEGLAEEPFGGTPSFSGDIGGVEYNILDTQIDSIIFTDRSGLEDNPPNSEYLRRNISATIKIINGEEMKLNEVETIWLGNSSDLSDDDWFSLSNGQSGLKVYLKTIQNVQVEQRNNQSYVIVTTSDGSKVEGKYNSGWSIAGKTDIGLFLIPLDKLASAIVEDRQE
jgi:hypothetical protein